MWIIGYTWPYSTRTSLDLCIQADLIEAHQYPVHKSHEHHFLQLLHWCVFIYFFHNEVHGKFRYVPKNINRYRDTGCHEHDTKSRRSIKFKLYVGPKKPVLWTYWRYSVGHQRKSYLHESFNYHSRGLKIHPSIFNTTKGHMEAGANPRL